MEHNLEYFLKEKDIDINIVNKNIPEYTKAYLDRQPDKNIGNTPASSHEVMYKDDKIPIILFSYGFIYRGSIFGFGTWKVIWFENIKTINIVNGNVTITANKLFELTPYDMNKFGDFVCKLEEFLNFFLKIIPSNLKPTQLCGLIKGKGGRRKTKRSKHSKRTKCNKKCKRRKQHTRRS